MALRISTPLPYLHAFYEGRDGTKLGGAKGWLDEALALGIASYAIVDGAEALVYDTHLSPGRGRFIRDYLTGLGVKKITVVLSHWHLDHVAGTQAFDDYPVLASAGTAQHFLRHQEKIRLGTMTGLPMINPLIRPTEIITNKTVLMVGKIRVELLSFNIHSDDATLVWVPSEQVLLAGDTLEDTVTYVDEPHLINVHLSELDRLWQVQPRVIFPSHGEPELIAGDGYERTFIRATQQYLRTLLRLVDEPSLRFKPLAELIRGPLDVGWVHYFAPYEEVHSSNVAQVLRSFSQ